MKDINFVETDTNTIKNNIITGYETLTGVTLSRAHPVRLFLEALAAIIVWLMNQINFAAKMNMLAYAVGDYLDHIGILVGCTRISASAAKTTIKVKLSAVRESAVMVPKGTRIATEDNVVFVTDENTEIAAGSTSVNVGATCETMGAVGNGYGAGEITTIIDHIGYVESMSNVSESEGGAEAEDDESYRERIRQAPEAFGSGTDGWYTYHTKAVSDLIGDVFVEGPEDRVAAGEESRPGEVVVYALNKDGTLPGQELKQSIKEYLTTPRVHYLTDMVSVEDPTVEKYDISLTYWIDRADSTQATAIQEAVKSAVSKHVEWQRLKLGRDINPSRLIRDIVVAGAKRVDITAPEFKVINPHSVAIAEHINVVYGGLEDG
ncbi:MAG: baseplate J/gp47 family protein [Veillonellaceae bacterium]|nr:baseplate J/gp47 family protein [Veillonellaceae bacterium]MCI7235430.1 baseplate J/gp47 family protein [Veillonellaceae bacterium]